VPGTCSNYENRLQNKDEVTGGATSNSNTDTTIPFENFTGSVPDCWQLVTGTATTHITSESATANVLFGSYSLEFAGDGSTKTKIKIAGADLYGSSQTDFNLYPGEKYLIGTWMKSDAAISAGTFEMYMDGTGYTASGKAITPTLSRSGNVVTLDCDDQTWTSSTITAKYAAIIRDADGNGSLAAGDIPVMYVDLETGGGSLSSSNGPFTITINASGLYTLTAAAS